MVRSSRPSRLLASHSSFARAAAPAAPEPERLIARPQSSPGTAEIHPEHDLRDAARAFGKSAPSTSTPPMQIMLARAQARRMAQRTATMGTSSAMESTGPNDFLAELSLLGPELHVSAGTTLVRAFDPEPAIYFLKQGTVKLMQKCADGREFAAAFSVAPTAIGITELLAGQTNASVVTLENCVVVKLARKTVLEAMQQKPEVVWQLAQSQAELVISLLDRCHIMAFNAVDTRIVKMLLELVKLFPLEVRNGLKIHLRLDQRILANKLAVSERSIGRGLKRLQDTGVISKRGGYFYILHLDKLKAAAIEEPVKVDD